MRSRPLWVVLLFVTTALAGCAADEPDGPPAASPTSTPSPTKDQGAALEQARRDAGRYVAWARSDFWVYEMDVRGLAEDEETHLVYYRELGPEYVVGTPTYEQALHHAVFSVNPILGRIHKGHLAPHERGEHAEMFPFEDGQIAHNKSWVTVFYGQQLALTARHDPAVPTPDGPQAGFRIEGQNVDGTFHITYSYVPAVKWFADLLATDADGTVIDMRLTESGTGYSGPAHFIRAKDLFGETLESDLLPATRTFTVDEDLVDDRRVGGFAIHSDITLGTAPLARLVLRDPDGNEIWNKTHEDPAGIDEIWPTGERPSGPADQHPQWPAGTYTLDLIAPGGAQATVRVAGTQDNSGSV